LKLSRNIFHFRILSILLIIVLIITLSGCGSSYKEIEKKVRIVLVGNLISEPMVKELTDKIANISKDQIYIDNLLYTGQPPKSEQEIAFQQKLMVMLAAGEGDIYVIDKNQFIQMAKMSGFIPLDEFVSKNNLNKYADKDCYVQAEDDKSPKLYGLKADALKILSDYGFQTKDKVIGVYVRTKKAKRAQSVILSLYQSIK